MVDVLQPDHAPRDMNRSRYRNHVASARSCTTTIATTTTPGRAQHGWRFDVRHNQFAEGPQTLRLRRLFSVDSVHLDRDSSMRVAEVEGCCGQYTKINGQFYQFEDTIHARSLFHGQATVCLIIKHNRKTFVIKDSRVEDPAIWRIGTL